MLGIDYTRHRLLSDTMQLDAEHSYFGEIDNTTRYTGPRGANLSTAERVAFNSLRTLVEDIRLSEDVVDLESDEEIVERITRDYEEYDAEYGLECSSSFRRHFSVDNPWIEDIYIRQYPREIRIIRYDGDRVDSDLVGGRCMSLSLFFNTHLHNTLRSRSVVDLRVWLSLYDTYEESTPLSDTTLYDLETGLVSLHPVSRPQIEIADSESDIGVVPFPE